MACGSTTELALLALPVARAMARPPISGFRVAAVGIEAEGDLILGANLEFPGDRPGVDDPRRGVRRPARSPARPAPRDPCRSRSPSLRALPADAREAANAGALAIVDLLGNERSLEDLYPWAFRPAALEHVGDDAGRDAMAEPRLRRVCRGRKRRRPDRRRRRAPGGGRPRPCAVLRAPRARSSLRLHDGRLLAAGCVESVAFNPSVTAMQAALVEVAAARAEASDIAHGWLGRTAGGPVDPEPGFRALLHAVAPDAGATVVDWRVPG